MTRLFDVYEINADFKVQLLPGILDLPTEIVELGDRILADGMEIGGQKYFDGMALAGLVFAGNKLLTRPVRYRFILAQRNLPGYKELLPIKIVGTSGLIITNSAVVFGKRSNLVTQYAGLYENAPSGGLDEGCLRDGIADYRVALAAEMVEELGMDEIPAHTVEPFILVFDQDEQTYDVVCKITFDSDIKNLLSVRDEESEYQEFQVVEFDALKEFVNKHSHEIVPTARAALRYLQLI